MSSKIERLNYYERETLHSFDFEAEQRYHMEMRRRLNQALHLWGIVDGLELCQGVLVEGAPEQLYVHPGMAIDAYGRELVLARPYPLDGDELEKNRINAAGTYKVWIAYDRQLATPPSPGFRVCELGEQYTRFCEQPRLLISNDIVVDETTAPTVEGSLSDDPIKKPWPILLGMVRVEIPGGFPTLTDVVTSAGERRYVGLRAQRLIAPAADPPADCADDFPDAEQPIRVEADLTVEKNQVIGEDFPIDVDTVEPAPADPTNFPGAAGNLKLQNLFLQQNLYASVAGQWLGLAELVKSLIPETQMQTLDLPLVPTVSDPSNGTHIVTLTSSLPFVDKASMVVSLAGIEWLSWNDFFTWIGTADAGSPIQLQVSVGAPSKQAGTNNVFDFPINWTVGPKDNPAIPADVMVNVRSVKVSYVAIFFP